MTTDWLEQRLRQWARWALASTSGGLGYPSQSITEAYRVDRSRGFASPEVDEASALVDRCIRKLPAKSRTVLTAHYLKPGTVADRAKATGLPRQTYYVILELSTATLELMIEEEEAKRKAH